MGHCVTWATRSESAHCLHLQTLDARSTVDGFISWMAWTRTMETPMMGFCVGCTWTFWETESMVPSTRIGSTSHYFHAGSMGWTTFNHVGHIFCALGHPCLLAWSVPIHPWIAIALPDRSLAPSPISSSVTYTCPCLYLVPHICSLPMPCPCRMEPSANANEIHLQPRPTGWILVWVVTTEHRLKNLWFCVPLLVQAFSLMMVPGVVPVAFVTIPSAFRQGPHFIVIRRTKLDWLYQPLYDNGLISSVKNVEFAVSLTENWITPKTGGSCAWNACVFWIWHIPGHWTPILLNINKSWQPYNILNRILLGVRVLTQSQLNWPPWGPEVALAWA
jgi:hypothetical protein